MWLNIALGIMIVGALINIVLTVIPMLLKGSYGKICGEEELVDREVVCPNCSKKMIPKLHLFIGKPSRSFCPHCGMKY